VVWVGESVESKEMSEASVKRTSTVRATQPMRFQTMSAAPEPAAMERGFRLFLALFGFFERAFTFLGFFRAMVYCIGLSGLWAVKLVGLAEIFVLIEAGHRQTSELAILLCHSYD